MFVCSQATGSAPEHTTVQDAGRAAKQQEYQHIVRMQKMHCCGEQNKGGSEQSQLECGQLIIFQRQIMTDNLSIISCINIYMQCLKKIRKVVCCITDPLFPVPYNFDFGSSQNLAVNKELFESNFIRTSKYTWYDFIPKSLILQFERIANVYFLVVAVLQTIPAISPLGPLTAWGPLIVVLGISMLREGYEDYRRYSSDQALNHESKCWVIRDGKQQQIEWSEVVTGDICKVREEELFPADLILLSSSSQGGNAFIETASLDGEKNLKPRNAYPATQPFNSNESIAKFRGKWQGIVPDKQLHAFESAMVVAGSQKINFSRDKQLLYRGTRLKNTQWIYGLAIYTGRNTKIMINSESQSSKMSQVQAKVNFILLFILLAQFILCIIVAVLDSVFIYNYKSTDYYINWSSYSVAGDAALIFCSQLVLMTTMIPISLIVSLEIVKVSQSYFIDKDKFMYSAFRDKGPMVRSASLNQELGQIQYIFTDKTGTLTTNRMQFKIAVIGKQIFGDIGLVINDPNRPPQAEKGFHDKELSSMMAVNGQPNSSKLYTAISVKDREKQSVIRFQNMKELAHEYLTALTIAHQVVVQKDKDGHSKYQGPSPDEITLVEAARAMGYQFLKTTQNSTQISINGKFKQFELLHTFAFDSDRKRMSVIVRDGGYIKLYIKGADSIITNRLSSDQNLVLKDELQMFSRIGLRTLLVGMRLISQKEYAEFIQNVNNLPLVGREQAFNSLVSSLEQNIYLLGATAVLDRLQDEVPETIRDLIRANIKIWMLTGDKMQTAENIAKSCNLIQPHFRVLKYNWDRTDANSILLYLKNMKRRADSLLEDGKKICFMIEGSYLTPIFQSDEASEMFIRVTEHCESVVCCRLLPIQKADVVSAVRKRLNKITLSIGDGANDVPMIKTAHIGIGLFGEEGMGAVQASDYALPEFRMLWRLLLVHGRWNYVRISEMILYFFYKNMLFTIPQFLFAFYCGYSAQTVFDDYYIATYNLVFTSLPLLARAILEQDVNYIHAKKQIQQREFRGKGDATLQRIPEHQLDTAYKQYIPKNYEINKYLYRLFPKIYFVGQENAIFNYKNFFFWILEGVVEACIISFFAFYIFTSASLSSSGYNPDLWIASLTIFTSVMLVVTFKLSTHTKFWSLMLFFVIIVLSLGLYVAYMWISNYHFSPYVLGTTWMFYTTGETYFLVLFCTCVVLFLDGFVLSLDMEYSGLVSKMRRIIQTEKEARLSSFERESVQISVQTVAPQ